MNKQPVSRRKGPRSFDRDEAVKTAMHLFWRHGYEAVSINDLTRAIGIAPPSLYSAFGNKAGLFREALELYDGLPGALDGLTEAATLEDAISGLLHRAVEVITDPAREAGCMISTGMLEYGADHADIAASLSMRRSQMQSRIAETLSRWLDKKTADAKAFYLATVMQGMSVQARDGVARSDLKQMINEVLAGLRL